MQNDRERFYELLKDIRTITMITRTSGSPGLSENGSDLGIRPMTIAKINQDCDIWILTGADTDAVKEIKTDSRVSIIAQQAQNAFLVMSGVGHVIHDVDQVRSIWQEPFRVWFPDGPDDPSIRIIHIDSKRGEYWDTQGVNKLKYLFAAARAYATGDRPESDDQHGTVRFT